MTGIRRNLTAGVVAMHSLHGMAVHVIWHLKRKGLISPTQVADLLPTTESFLGHEHPATGMIRQIVE